MAAPPEASLTLHQGMLHVLLPAFAGVNVSTSSGSSPLGVAMPTSQQVTCAFDASLLSVRSGSLPGPHSITHLYAAHLTALWTSKVGPQCR